MLPLRLRFIIFKGPTDAYWFLLWWKNSQRCYLLLPTATLVGKGTIVSQPAATLFMAPLTAHAPISAAAAISAGLAFAPVKFEFTMTQE